MKRQEILVVYGDHRNEVSAWILAPPIIGRLRAMGYAVKPAPMPDEVSLFHQVMNADLEGKTPKEIKEIGREIDRKIEDWYRKLAKANPKALIVTAHNLAVHPLGRPPEWRKHKNNSTVIKWFPGTGLQSDRLIVLEIPSIVKNIPNQKVAAKHSLFSQFKWYGTKVTDLEQSEAAGLLSEKMVKAASAIIAGIAEKRLPANSMASFQTEPRGGLPQTKRNKEPKENRAKARQEKNIVIAAGRNHKAPRRPR